MGGKHSTTAPTLRSSRNWKKALRYETDMFAQTWHMLESYRELKRSRSPHLHDAVLESALLHTRILADFFLSKGSAQDGDVRLRDVRPSFRSSRIRELRRLWGSGKKAKSHCWTLNKMLAHLTDQRSGSYDYRQLRNEVVPVIKKLILELASFEQKEKG